MDEEVMLGLSLPVRHGLRTVALGLPPSLPGGLFQKFDVPLRELGSRGVDRPSDSPENPLSHLLLI